MRPWPDSLLGRTVFVLLGGVLLSNVVGLVVYSGERLDLLTSDRGRQLAERVAAAASLLTETAIEERQRTLRPLRGPGFRVFWSERPAVTVETDDWRTRLIRRALLAELGDIDGDRLKLTYGRPPDSEGSLEAPAVPGFGGGPARRRGPPLDRPLPEGALLGSFQLSDGSWLNFAAPLEAFQPFWATRAFLMIMGTTAAVLMVSIWTVGRASQPLAMFAAAAERLGLDMNAPPLPEVGPREVRQASRAFNTMQRRLQRFARDRTRVLAAISHDLRTPSTRMRLRAEWIEDDEQRSKMLGDLEAMEAMIAATLAFARDEFVEEPRVSLDLAVLVQTVCEEAEDAGRVVVYRGPSHAAYCGRPVALKRAFANLVDNAVTYGDGAQVVLIETPAGVEVTVDDDGPGLPESELDRVFEPFYRIEASRSRETGGVGLGLAVVRSAIGAHGGEVKLSNRPEGGLRATVILPKSIDGVPARVYNARGAGV